MDELVKLIAAGLIGSGGVVGAQGLLARVFQMRHESQQAEHETEHELVAAQAARESAMAEAVVELARDNNNAMIQITSESVSTGWQSLANMAAQIATIRSDNQDYFLHVRQGLEQLTGVMQEIKEGIAETDERLSALVTILSSNGKEPTDEPESVRDAS